MKNRKKQNEKKQTLHQQIRKAIFLFALVPLTLVAILSFYFLYQNRVGRTVKDTKEKLQAQVEAMESEMSMIELMARSIWADTTFTTEVGQAAINDKLGEYNKYLFQERTLSTLKIVTSISQVQAARLHLEYQGLREYGRYLYSMDKAKKSTWYSERNEIGYSGKWYWNSLDEQVRIGYSDYFSEKNMASYVIPVKISNDLTGIFEIVIPMRMLLSELYSNNKNSDVFMMDANGVIYGLDSNGKYAGITKNELEKIAKTESFFEDDQDLYVCKCIWNGEPTLLTAERNPRTNVYVMKILSMEKQYQKMFIELFGLIVLESVIVLVLYLVISRIVGKLLRDFDVFSSCIKEVEKGNLNVRIPVLSQLEVNDMAIEYNKMLCKVTELMDTAVRREVMVKEAQIRSLEKQINSHFLYNVLDAIRMMAEVKGIYNVSDALLALARMFRYNLKVDSHYVLLQEEIAYLENYLKLCNIRYDYYITLSENITDEVRNLKVPKIILQPIAENSIVHGLDELAEDTTIYLKVYQKEKVAYIEMTDMGKGMDEAELQNVRDAITFGGGGEHSTNGIGLHNIHERIQLMYGSEYGVEVYSKEQCYTKVVLKIPVQK